AAAQQPEAEVSAQPAATAAAPKSDLARLALARAIAAPSRTPANVARDKYRHPLETLTFFGVEPDDTVVELWPGGGWYTEILAPYLAERGTLYGAAPAGRGTERFRAFLAARPDVYGKVRVATFPMAAGGTKVPDGSADVVLTFRNVHNWMGSEGAPPVAPQAFREIFAMLKPGGVLGIVDHRLPAGADAAREKASGYLKVATVRGLAEAAGFRFAGSSEVNANPRDTADWPEGLWTLPPTLRLKDKDREKYLAIGESDRMTLKFVKPG
ncbi:MAG TPA: methyltransferase domain-containing protein, partial [Allosphingosinicella sp.]|nr:methyltransferase domain-containing protein [Allosphingosinicella sp.]